MEMLHFHKSQESLISFREVVEFLEIVKCNGNGKCSSDFKEEIKHGGC